MYSTRSTNIRKKDLQALTSVGPREDPVLDPLAVLHLNNRLYFVSEIKLLCKYTLI